MFILSSGGEKAVDGKGKIRTKAMGMVVHRKLKPSGELLEERK